MRGLAAAEVLAVWERAAAEPATTRPAALLDAAGSAGSVGAADLSATDLGTSELPLGARDAALLRLYAATFGDHLDALAACPSCGTAVELSLSCAELLGGCTGGAPVQPLKYGYVVDWRLPTTADLAAASTARSAAEAGALLLRRCVLAAALDGAPVSADELPDDVREAVGAAMAAADPLAEIALDLGCPHCRYVWSSRLDVAEFVWQRLDAAAQHLFREVHELARGYGWTEPQILALSPARRATYLRLVGNG